MRTARDSDRPKGRSDGRSDGRLRVLWLTNIPLPAVRRRQGLPPLTRGGWLDSLARPLVEQCPSVELICSAYAQQAPEPFTEAGVGYVTLPMPGPVRRFRSMAREWRATLRPKIPVQEMRELIADVEPDVIHVHGTEMPHSLAALEAAGETPALVSIQGPVSRLAASYWASLSPARRVGDVLSLDFLKGRGLVHGGLRMNRAAARERATVGLAGELSGRTEWDRDVVSELNPRARYWHIDEVLRDPFYRVRWSRRDSSAPVILTTSGAAPYKGLDVLLRSFAQVVQGRRCELHVAGDLVGSAVWPHLDRIQKRLGLVGRVTWLGDASAEELAERIAGCSVFACASRIENSSNSVCEAMLVGAPTVAPATGGIPSLIDHERDGLLFPVADHVALADAIERLLADPALAARLGGAARSRAASRHDPAHIARSMCEAYEMIAGGDG